MTGSLSNEQGSEVRSVYTAQNDLRTVTHPGVTAIKLSSKTPTKSIINEARQRAITYTSHCHP